MSGGYFDYQQNRLEYIATSIDELIASNDNTKLNSYGQEIGLHYPPDIIAKFNETRKTLRLAAAMAQRVDWLVSGDDGEETFRERWAKNVDSPYEALADLVHVVNNKNHGDHSGNVDIFEYFERFNITDEYAEDE